MAWRWWWALLAAGHRRTAPTPTSMHTHAPLTHPIAPAGSVFSLMPTPHSTARKTLCAPKLPAGSVFSLMQRIRLTAACRPLLPDYVLIAREALRLHSLLPDDQDLEDLSASNEDGRSATDDDDDALLDDLLGGWGGEEGGDTPTSRAAAAVW